MCIFGGREPPNLIFIHIWPDSFACCIRLEILYNLYLRNYTTSVGDLSVNNMTSILILLIFKLTI